MATRDDHSTHVVRSADEQIEFAVEKFREALRGLRYGEVTVTVQDGVVVQIERTERQRPQRPKK